MTPEYLSKFENCDDLELGIHLYEHAQIETTEELGSVFDDGRIALVLIDDPMEFPHDGYILFEDVNGYVTYEAFNTHEQAELRFETLVEDYYSEFAS